MGVLFRQLDFNTLHFLFYYIIYHLFLQMSELKHKYWYVSIYILKLLLFWLLFSVLGRLVFYAYNHHETAEVEFSEILASFYHAVYLDLSFASYLIIIPFLLLLIQTLTKANVLNIVNKWAAYIFMFLVATIVASELGIYEEWKEKLSFKALSYLARPDEVYRSARGSVIITGLLLIALQMALGVWFFNKYIFENIRIEKRNYLFSAVWFMLMPGFILLGMRGGVQQIPISQSAVYFSHNNFVNLATVNSAWNLFFSLDNNIKNLNTNPFVYYSAAQARQNMDSLFYTQADTTISILTTQEPNVVFVLLESWTADVVEPLGGYPEIAPRFAELAKDGLLFTKHYSNGMLSHQAVVALLSSFPSTPQVEIIKHPEKYQDLPSWNKRMNNYYSSFHFGGHLHYGNIKSYMYFNQFDEIYEVTDFPSNALRGKMGVHDEGLYDKMLADISKHQQPFFAGAFTQSSHSPYDVPMPDVIKAGGKDQPFLNGVFYADSCLGNFIDRAKKQLWFDNTLFIFLADHSHGSPRNWNYYAPQKRKTPMLFYGNVLKKQYRGATYDKFSSQLDVAKTILAQLGKDYSGFEWGRNLFNPYTPDFTFYVFDDGFGLLTPDDYLVYNEMFEQKQKIYIDSTKTPERRAELLKLGKSYLQTVFQEYLDY